jgi:hypothetical protein
MGDAMLQEVSRVRPDVVCLSALPPYAMAYARHIYEELSAQMHSMEIIIGLWNYTGDLDKAASVISGEKGNFVCTTLAQAVQRVSGLDPMKLSGRERNTDAPAIHA